jgi:hypothetical protein
MEIYDFKCIFWYISPIEKKMCKQSVLISSSVCIQMLCLTVTLLLFFCYLVSRVGDVRSSEINQVETFLLWKKKCDEILPFFSLCYGDKSNLCRGLCLWYSLQSLEIHKKPVLGGYLPKTSSVIRKFMSHLKRYCADKSRELVDCETLTRQAFFSKY